MVGRDFGTPGAHITPVGAFLAPRVLTSRPTQPTVRRHGAFLAPRVLTSRPTQRTVRRHGFREAHSRLGAAAGRSDQLDREERASAASERWRSKRERSERTMEVETSARRAGVSAWGLAGGRGGVDGHGAGGVEHLVGGGPLAWQVALAAVDELVHAHAVLADLVRAGG